jgi:hypothetical protein
VVLNDQASPQLVTLRNNLQQLTRWLRLYGQVEKFKHDQSSMTAKVKELTTAVIGGERAMIAFAVRMRAVGLALTAGGHALLKRYHSGRLCRRLN